MIALAGALRLAPFIGVAGLLGLVALRDAQIDRSRADLAQCRAALAGERTQRELQNDYQDIRRDAESRDAGGWLRDEGAEFFVGAPGLSPDPGDGYGIAP